MRKVLKILHTLAAGGLIGGLGGYMLLLAMAPQETPAAYADLRQSIAALSNYLLLPSLAVGLVSGLLSMAQHRPFIDKGWAWLKAVMGILMFKGVLTVIGAHADQAAGVSRRIADGEPVAEVLDAAIAYEWHTLWVVMALSVANVVLGIWRPRLSRRPQPRRQSAPKSISTAPSEEAEPARSAA